MEINEAWGEDGEPMCCCRLSFFLSFCLYVQIDGRTDNDAGLPGSFTFLFVFL